MEQNCMQVDVPLLDAGNTENINAVFPTDICETFLEDCFAGAFVNVNCSEASQKNGKKTNRPSVAAFCRVCAMRKPHVLPIYGDYGREFRLARKINKYLPIVVSESDKLPLVLCRECVTNFAAFDKMFENSLRAERKLMSMLETENNVMKVKDEMEVKDEWNQRIKSSSKGEERIGHLFGNKTSVAVGTTEVTQAKHSYSEVSRKRVEPKQETNDEYDDCLLVKCTYCKFMFLNKDLLEHAEFCEGREEFSMVTNIEQHAKLPRKSNGLGINTKRLMEVFGTKPQPRIKKEKMKSLVKKNTPVVRKKDKKNKTIRKKDKRNKTIVGQYSVVGGKYVCGLCCSELPDSSAFVTHRKKDCPFPHFTCSYCDYGFRGNNHLKTHIRNYHMEQREEYICDVCGKNFFNKLYFRNHVKYHFQERAFKCDKCLLDFKRMDRLRFHQKNKHGMPMGMAKWTKFVCAICSGQFRNESELRIHQLKHTGDKSYVCEKCGNGFFSLKSLRYHQSRTNCTETKKKQIQKYNKAAYERRKNEPPKFHCEQCPRSFRYNFLLRRHVRCVHLGLHEKSFFTCKLCDMKFRHISTLARHKAKEHTGFKYACSICSRRFIFPSDVKNHMLVHRTDKSHGCPECGKLFKYLGDMTRHIKMNHLKGKSSGAKENEL